MEPCNYPRYNFQKEEQLTPLIAQIEQEKFEELTLRKIAPLVKKEVVNEFRERPSVVCAKVLLIGISVLLLKPLFVSAVSCFNAYRIQPWRDVFSSDTEKMTSSTQWYPNLGHSVGYSIEGIEIVILTTFLLLIPGYKRAVCQVIDSIYKKRIQDPDLPNDDKEFLYEIKRLELLNYGYAHTIRRSKID